ncbi:MAG: RNA polymerase sigma factor [bacterium]
MQLQTEQTRKTPLARVGNEQSFIERASQGDTEAFHKLFEHYKLPVFHFITRMVGRPEDAEDITQEVFVRIYQRLPSLREPKAFSSWLFTTARNESINYLRKKNRRQASSLEAMQENTVLAQPINQNSEKHNPEQIATEGEMASVVQNALSAIPEINRSAFVLGVLEGYSYKEVAEMLECSVNNVKLRVFRARALLSQKLKPYFSR